MKRSLLAGFFALALITGAFAQGRTVSGTVTSGEDGNTLPGVNVIVKGTSSGVSTDLDGKYRIEVPSGGILEFSYLGFLSQEVEVGARSVVDITLQPDLKQLDEVVVTALGFEEDRDQLGSTFSKVGGEAIAQSGETTLLNGLAAKASGLTIQRNSGDPGAGAYIQIRGQSTIQGSLQPLIVVDGVPITSSTIGSGTAGVTQQSRINDINPNDIESIQVLKGASAAALWGTRAGNGVIIIKTKDGQKGKMRVSYRGSYSIDQVNLRPQLSQNYGQGSAGSYGFGSALSWGDHIPSRSGGADEVDQTGARFESANGNTYYNILTKNSTENFNDSNWDDIFQNGYAFDNALTISGGDDRGTYYLSVGDLNQQGTIRNNSAYRRTTTRLNTSRNFGDMVTLKNSFQYSKVTGNRIQTGSNLSGMLLGLLRTPSDFDNRDYIGNYFSSPDAAPAPNRHRSYRNPLGAGGNPRYNNPSFTANEQINDSDLDRFIVSGDLIVKPTDWLDFTARVGYDSYAERRDTYFPVNSGSFPAGQYDLDLYKQSQLNVDIIGKATRSFGSAVVTALGGFNYNSRRYDRLSGSTQNLIIGREFLNLANATADNTTPDNFWSYQTQVAGYGSINVALMEEIFLNVTGRGERYSSFPDLVFYPSADLAWQFSKTLGLEGSAFSFGKLRASFGQVGIQPRIYSTVTTFETLTYTEGWGPGLDPSNYGGGFTLNDDQGNPNLRPEIKTEWEIGTDLRFIDDRVSLNLTYYNNVTNDILLDVNVSPATGYNNIYANAGQLRNQGIELDLGAQIVQTDDFQFGVDLNWTRNRNEVTDLQGADFIGLNGFTSAASGAVVGQPLGVIYGGRWARDDNGNLLEDPARPGFPYQDLTDGVIGDPNPEWRAGLGINLSYKGLRLYTLFDRVQGGDMWAGTTGALSYFGRAGFQDFPYQTVDQEYDTYFGTITPADGDNRILITEFFPGQPVALDWQYYFNGPGSGFTGPAEPFIKDASHTRLREMTLSYNLTGSYLERVKLQNVNLSVTGRNLWLRMDDQTWEEIDPETNLTGNSNGRGLIYFNNPNTRSLLFTLQLNF
ncbi:MAG TPA: SusC/RagA family TonB-linked outer membrane protein [Cytophagales bacterium]|nr:SusC/RagA family TonB-linked outer membrane protein [Cytophagales bacterium]HAA20253.1 SusC/RagA family TonB-linked outer membrane protein [Cytophagales bacterium]HAP61787.1 SusC/RagA family TonB-linked outer membrane protein [Cytophagales bacterium]